MQQSDIDSIRTFYLERFTQPLLRSANTDQINDHIKIVEQVFKEHLSFMTGISSFEFYERLIEAENIINVDEYPLISINESSVTLDEDTIDVTEDFPYKIYDKYVNFYTAVGPGELAFEYSAGKAIDEKIKMGYSLEINHLIETKMIDNEKVGVINVTPDRTVIPKEVKALLGISDLQVGVL